MDLPVEEASMQSAVARLPVSGIGRRILETEEPFNDRLLAQRSRHVEDGAAEVIDNFALIRANAARGHVGQALSLCAARERIDQRLRVLF